MFTLPILYIELILLLGFSLWFDIRTGKIRNIVIFPAFVIGILTNVLFFGVDGLFSSWMGLIIPVIILFVFYWLKMLGAGDIKLFAAIGAIMGYNFLFTSLIMSLFAGALIAAAVLIKRGNAKERFKFLIDYLRECFYSRSLKPYKSNLSENDGSSFRFSYAIASGTVLSVLVLNIIRPLNYLL